MAKDNSWVFGIESTIFTIVEKRISEKLSDDYPDLYITNSDKNTDDPVFPTIYLHELPGSEQGNDLEGKDINAVMETFQVEVTSARSQQEAKKVLAEVLVVFKEMRFQITAMPEFKSGDETYRSIARCRRLIGASECDTLGNK